MWDLHDEGVILMNDHAEFMRNMPDWEENARATDQWVEEWLKSVEKWRTRMNEALTAFAPAEARRLKNVVTFTKQLKGLNDIHTHHMNILRERLERFGKILERHHPALLPE